jgi:Domain of unknown function (DUF4394)
MTSYDTNAASNKLTQTLRTVGLQDYETIRDRARQWASDLGTDLSDDTLKQLLGSLTKTSFKPDPTTSDFVGLTAKNDLAFFNADNLKNVTQVQVKGLKYDETLVGVDFRPNTGQLFAVNNGNRLYTIDVKSGTATQVGTDTFAVRLNGQSFGVDFNPVVDRIRVVSDAGQNLRLNPDTGAVTDFDPMVDGVQADGNLNGATDSIVAAGYINSFTGTTSTTLYGIDAESDQLFVQNPPNDGTQNLVGSLGADFAANAGFDIVFKNGTNSAFATSDSLLYSINLQSGAATLLGTVRDGITPVNLAGFAATGM